MMKYIILPLLLFIPFMSMADDHCTNPMKYTIDKRCYVTDGQKKTAPYNASVSLIHEWSDEYPYCSGTIVKGADEHPYLYTAAHCTKGIDSQVYFKLPDGRYGSAFIQTVGNKGAETQDWAVGLVVSDKNIPTVGLSNKKITEVGKEKNYNARVIGHGGLKIMSDKDIADFKTKYKTFLESEKEVDPTAQERLEKFDSLYDKNGFLLDDPDTLKKIDLSLYDFLMDNSDYLYSLMADSKNLKVSNCKYTNHGRDIHCQVWSGNSGGGVFDNSDKLIAIHSATLGGGFIGGQHHAGDRNKEDATNRGNIPIKTLPQPDATTADVK